MWQRCIRCTLSRDPITRCDIIIEIPPTRASSQTMLTRFEWICDVAHMAAALPVCQHTRTPSLSRAILRFLFFLISVNIYAVSFCHRKSWSGVHWWKITLFSLLVGYWWMFLPILHVRYKEEEEEAQLSPAHLGGETIRRPYWLCFPRDGWGAETVRRWCIYFYCINASSL